MFHVKKNNMKTKKLHNKQINIIKDDLKAAKEAFKEDYSDLNLISYITTDEQLLLTKLFGDYFIIQ